VDGLQVPDITPPQTRLALAGTARLGETITLAWEASDDRTGVARAALWHQSPQGEWEDTGQAQDGSSGQFSFTLTEACGHRFSIRSADGAGNLEPFDNGANAIALAVDYCPALPLVFK
jgi:hypothetical protein